MATAKPSPLDAALAADKGDGDVVQKDVFSDITLRLQLLAIGCSEWLKKRTCCCCCPVTNIGGFVVCFYALLRGFARLNEVFGPVHLILEYSVENPLAVVGRVLTAIAGVGDILAGLMGLYGVYYTRRGPVTVLFLWLGIACILRLVTLPVAIAFDTTMHGHAVAIFAALFEIAVDMYHLFVCFQLLLLVTYKASVSDDVDGVFSQARSDAVEHGDGRVTTTNIISCLMENDKARELLSGSVPSQLGSDPADSHGTFFHEPSRKTVRFSSKANDLVTHAASLQMLFGHRQLQVEHLVAALCILGRGSNGVNTAKLTSRLEELCEEEDMRTLKAGPPPVRLSGIFPAEDTCLVLSVCQLLFSFVSLIYCIFYGMSLLQRVLSVRPLNSLWWLEFLLHVGNVAMCIVGIGAIQKNRQARRDIRAQAYRKGVRWGAELGECYLAVKQDAEKSLDALETSSKSTYRVLLWMVVQFFLEVLIYLMLAAVADLCGFYLHFLTIVAQLGPGTMYSRVDCSRHDVILICTLAVFICLRVWFAYALLVLWHEYGFGWTTTDAGIGALIPSTRVPDSWVRNVAGLPPPWAGGVESGLHRSAAFVPMMKGSFKGAP
mmetsp:Transcript_35246/g.64440  ORF Transcript_35246/g.64440 Transcript_35246/m.64440 type:complete len:605 (-) Transcript_35246:58-1872(-)